MKSKLFRISVLVLCVLFLVGEGASMAQYQQPPGSSPPIGQPLVREGDFAMKLAPALGLGTPANEAEAESKLTSLGIGPKNGWIADYPVTPDILGEVEASVGEAADAGSLNVEKDTALRAVQDIAQGYALPVSAEGQGETQAPSPGTTVVNNYYTTEGPPVVTYYAPPPDYAYLYTWVPYPFWWWDFWFPGFYVLADFDVRVHHRFHGREYFGVISNHYREPISRRFLRIDPTSRFRGGTSIGTRFRGGAPERPFGGTRGYSAPSPSGSRTSVFERFGNSRFEGRAGDRGFSSRFRSGQLPPRPTQMPSRPARIPGGVFRDRQGGTFHGGGWSRGGGGGGGTRGGGGGGDRGGGGGRGGGRR